MNLKDAMSTMGMLQDPTEEQVRDLLEEGYHIILGDISKHGDMMLKYDLHVMDGVFYASKVSDSTREEIILTPEMVALFEPEFFGALYESYIAQRDALFLDSYGHMLGARMRMAYSHDSLKQQLKTRDKGTIVFNDEYSPIDGLDASTVRVRVVDNPDAAFLGSDVISETVKVVAGTELVDDPDEADVQILILPNATKAPHKKFFEPLTDKTARIPVVAETLEKMGMAATTKNVILFWSSNAFMTSLFHPQETQLKATMDLAEILPKYAK